MSQYYLIIDVALCQDCGACFLACKDEHFDNTFSGYTLNQKRHGQKWLRHPRKERAQGSLMEINYLPQPCMHCANAPCIKAGGGAIQQRPDGVVLIDPEKAKGKEELEKSCPYGAISWNEEHKLAQKCTMCAHLLDEGWKETRCSQICATGAIKIKKLSDTERDELIKREKLEAYRPELGTNPHVLYKNLHLFTRAFIAGSVAAMTPARDGSGKEVLDCVENAEVILKKGKETVAKATTDNYGDFKFDGLMEDGSSYVLSINAGKQGKTDIEVKLDKSIYLADITL